MVVHTTVVTATKLWRNARVVLEVLNLRPAGTAHPVRNLPRNGKTATATLPRMYQPVLRPHPPKLTQSKLPNEETGNVAAHSMSAPLSFVKVGLTLLE